LKKNSTSSSSGGIFMNQSKMSSSKRLIREYKDTQKNPEKDLKLKPSENDIHSWTACFYGPKDSPYEGGVFEIQIVASDQYPIKPPKAYFITKIFHPNIHFKVFHF
jgi:ubiquitin-protein ligase